MNTIKNDNTIGEDNNEFEENEDSVIDEEMQRKFQLYLAITGKTGLGKGRTGWINRLHTKQEDKDRVKKDPALQSRGFNEGIETIAAHSGKLMKTGQLFCIAHPEMNLDIRKISLMALFHDLAEYKEKDYVPGEIPAEEKYKKEKAVIVSLVPYFGQEILDLREEFEKCETPEAIILKQLDKLDAMVRALEYERLGYTDHRMTEFYENILKPENQTLKDPDLRRTLTILLKKKYNHVDYINQYYVLLECNADEEIFDEVMMAAA